jgi:hypothetical protein
MPPPGIHLSFLKLLGLVPLKPIHSSKVHCRTEYLFDRVQIPIRNSSISGTYSNGFC